MAGAKSIAVLTFAVAIGCNGAYEGSTVDGGAADTSSSSSSVEGSVVHGVLDPPITALSTAVGGATEVIVVGAPLDCDTLARSDWMSRLPAGAFVLRLGVAGAAPARYEIGTSPELARARWTLATDPPSPEPRAASGNVTVMSSAATGVTGTFELLFDDGGDATGSFVAAICPP